MNARVFARSLTAELAEPWAAEQWERLPNKCRPTTEFMGKVFEAMAARSGKLRQVPELWRIDFLWFPLNVSTTPYYSGSTEREYPLEAPVAAIEHENYGHHNVGAAFLRLLGVRAGLRVLVAWSADLRESLDRLVSLRDMALKGGAFQRSDKVLAVLFSEHSEAPTFSAYMIESNCWEQVSA